MTPGSKLFASTTFRLSVTFLLLFAAAAALAIGYIYWNTNVLLTRQLDDTVQAEIQGLAEQYRDGGITSLTQTIAERSQTPGNSLYLLATDAEHRIAGNLTSVSRELWNTVGRVEFRYTRPAPGGTETRLAFASVFRLPGGFRLIVGRDIEDRRKFGQVVLSAAILALGLMALVGLGGGFLVSRNILARIDSVTDTSRTIMAGDMSGRVPITGSGDEFDRLAQNLNAMLERIEQLMAGLREVSDNIAHDLKTPLSRLRNRVEAALDQPDETAHREALEKTIEEADGLIRTFNALLSIARLEAGAAGEAREDVDMAALVRDVAELYEPVVEEEGVALDVEAEGPVPIRADRQLLGQAIANLLDNALKYGTGNARAANTGTVSTIELSAHRNGQSGLIIVADHGAGIPEADRERVLKRFVRLEASRSDPGSGLGLALVAAVARLHSGTVHLEDNDPGLRVVLSLPLQEHVGEGTKADGGNGAGTRKR